MRGFRSAALLIVGFVVGLASPTEAQAASKISVTKAFSPTIVLPGTPSQVTLTFQSTTGSAQTAFLGDSLPNGLVVANPAGAVSTCGGGLENGGGPGSGAPPGSVFVFLGNATVPATGSCTLVFNVVSSNPGDYQNSAAFNAAGDSFSSFTNTATLTVLGPPTITKSFNSASIAVGGTSTMSFAINNSNAATLGGVAFSDTLPAGMQLANPVFAFITSSGCSGFSTPGLANGGTVFAVAGLSIATGTCTITVPVVGVAAGVLTNVTSNVTATSPAALTGNTGSATLTVVAPPTITKSFSPASIPVGGNSTVTLTATNPNAVVLHGAAVTDTLVNMVSAGTFLGGTCLGASSGGTLLTGATALAFSVPALAANGSCTLTFAVTSSTLGVLPNTASGVTTTETPTAGTVSNTATLTVLALPTITKSFGAASIPLGGSTSLIISVTNPNASALTNVSFSDTMPPGLSLAIGANPNGNCANFGATFTGSSAVSAHFTLGAGLTCTVTLTVTGIATGVQNNVTSAVSSNETGAGNPSNTATLTVLGPPQTSKSFTPSTVDVAATSKVTITVHNPNASPMTGVSFTDAMPASLIIITPSDVSSVGCGVAAVGAAGTSAVSLTGGSIAANSDCVITVAVIATAPGTQVNTTSTVAGTAGGFNLIGAAATATLQVGPSNAAFYVSYAANLTFGDSVVNMTNTGQFSSLPGVPNPQNGNICANVYTYSPDEQLVSCCSCLVTPNALNSLSVNGDLASNTLTPIKPSAVVMKMVASAPGAGTGSQACNPATVTRAGAANFLVPGLAAWGATLHAVPVTAGTPAGTYGTTETPFLMGTFSDAELTRMTQLCSFIQANGSGYGICKSCKVGGLGAASK